MSDLAQTLAVILIGAGALACVLRQALRRLWPQSPQKRAGCGACNGCSGGGCGSGPGRR